MAWFKIYAGVAGSFGGAKYIGTYNYSAREDAEQSAREEAWSAFETFSSRIRPRSVDAIMEEDGLTEEEAIEVYEADIEDTWLRYHVEEATGPDDKG